jgi:hypothetical protein
MDSTNFLEVISVKNQLDPSYPWGLLSVTMSFLCWINGSEINGTAADYFLRRYNSYFKESIVSEADFLDNTFVEFGLILILFSLFMCDLLVV